MRERGLRLLGLGLRAGRVVVGTGGVRRALQSDALSLVVLAEDFSPRTGAKVLRLARGKGVGTVLGPPASELGRLLGRDSVQAIGVRDRGLANGIAGPDEHGHHAGLGEE